MNKELENRLINLKDNYKKIKKKKEELQKNYLTLKKEL